MSSARESLLEALASLRQEVTGFTQELVAIPTENPPGAHYAECAEAIAHKLSGLGLEVERHGHSVLGFYGSGSRTLYFHGHYDVVPAQSEAQFHPNVDQDHLFGRGSADMKSGLAAMVYAAEAIRRAGVKLDGRIGLVMVPDEETGGARGSRALVEAGVLGRGGIGMLTPEPTGGVVWNASRGALSLRITVKGRAAHVGLQHQGVNAFEGMLRVAAELQKLKAEVEARETSFRLEPEAARRSILMIGGQCAGGTSFNTVPASCSFTVDRRVNPEEDFETEKGRLFALLERLRKDGVELEVEILQEGHPAGVPEDSPLARALSAAIEEITGQRPSFEMCPGLLEIRFYAQQAIPAFAYGPGALAVSHGPQECVSLQKMYACATIYALTAARLLSAD